MLNTQAPSKFQLVKKWLIFCVENVKNIEKQGWIDKQISLKVCENCKLLLAA